MSFILASNIFGKKLLLKLLEEKPLQNAVISAVSIEGTNLIGICASIVIITIDLVALAMAGEGSVGETRKEIFQVLGISLEVWNKIN